LENTSSRGDARWKFASGIIIIIIIILVAPGRVVDEPAVGVGAAGRAVTGGDGEMGSWVPRVNISRG